MHAGDGGRGQELEERVAIAHRVEAVRGHRRESEILRQRLEVDREGGAGERRRAERQRVGARAAVAKSLAVTLQHKDVREQVVAEDDRLGPLQVRVARQRCLHRLGRARGERLLHAAEAGPDARDHLAQVEPLVERDLVVPGAPGVQLSPDVADQLLETPLDVRVDVLELGPEREGARGQLVPNGLEPLHDRVALRRRQEAGLREGLCPRDAAGDVMRPETTVEGERSGEALGGRIGAPGEAPAPELLGRRCGGGRGLALSGPRLHGNSAAMSSMIRRVTWSRTLRRPLAPSSEKQRAGPNLTPSGTRRGM